MTAYNDFVDELQKRYGDGHAVILLSVGRANSFTVTYCSWPNFCPFVMPSCRVVSLTRIMRTDGQATKTEVVGYAHQDRVLEVLGKRVKRVTEPMEHLVCDGGIGDADRQAILNLMMPTIAEAVIGERGWTAD